jgi:hypothetical protein
VETAGHRRPAILNYTVVIGDSLVLLCEVRQSGIEGGPGRVTPSQVEHRVPTPPPLPLRVAKAGRNNFNEEITPILPTGIGDRYSQTISNLGHAAQLRRWELPL